MSISMEPNNKSRNSDLCNEPVGVHLAPIKGYEEKPLVSLVEAIKPISEFFSGIQNYVDVALKNSENSADGLTLEESASIYLYTMQIAGGCSLYRSLNQSLRAENREELIPWFSYLKLFLTALHKLPPQSGTVWRGVRNVDLSSIYKEGTKFFWWGVSSCTTNVEVIEAEDFVGKDGLRTLFCINCINGRSISNHSHYRDAEREVLLLPGSYFEVLGQANTAPGHYIIHLKEIPLPVPVVEPTSDKLNDSNSPPVVRKSSISSPSLKWSPFNWFSKSPPKATALNLDTKWKQDGTTVAGRTGAGNQLNQLSNPFSITMDFDETMYIADLWNDRVLHWKLNATDGQIVAGGNQRGNQTNQLNRPRCVVIDKKNDSLIISDSNNRRIMRWSRKNRAHGEIFISDIHCYGLAIDRYGSIYVSDYEKHEVRRWNKGDKQGKIVAGGNGKGNQLNRLDCPASIFVGKDFELYISDQKNHRVMKWAKDAKEGIIIAGGNGCGKSFAQLSSPEGVIVDPLQLNQIYIADTNNQRVMRWSIGATEGILVVGGNGVGQKCNQFHTPTGLSFDQQRNLYVVDCTNNRIQKLEVD